MKHQTVVLSHQQMEQPVSVEGPCPYFTELSGPIPANQSTLGILSDLIMNYFSIHKMESKISQTLYREHCECTCKCNLLGSEIFSGSTLHKFKEWLIIFCKLSYSYGKDWNHCTVNLYLVGSKKLCCFLWIKIALGQGDKSFHLIAYVKGT